MHELNEAMKPVQQLCKIFPDIEGELCSRHSTLFGKLRTTFNKLYDSLEPEYYIVVKGSAVLFGDSDARLSMGLENGLIIMVRQTYSASRIFINGNHVDDELIYSHDGRQKEGMHPQADDIGRCLELANENLKPDQLFGGIVYIHANIPQETFMYRNAMLIGTFIAFLLINRNVQNLTVEEIFTKLGRASPDLTKPVLMEYFRYYRPRTFHLQVDENNYGVDLESKYKTIVCKLDVAQADLSYQQKKKAQYAIQKLEVTRKLKEQHQLGSIFELFSSQQEISLEMEADSSKYALSHSNFLQMSLKDMSTLCEFSNKDISFWELVKTKWELDSKYWQVYSEEVVQLVENLKKQLKVDSCMLFQEQFLLIVTERHKFTELIVKLRQKMHNGEMKSKSLFKIEEELIEHRWGSDKNIGENMFTSVPSEGVAIFDPSQAIWFDN